MANKSKPNTEQSRRGGGGATRDGGKRNECSECHETLGRHAVNCSKRG
jgi:hypothetical protein